MTPVALGSTWHDAVDAVMVRALPVRCRLPSS
jgi:hypothetical protein